MLKLPFLITGFFLAPVSFAQCGSVTIIDGNLYTAVQIGNLCRSDSNLKTTLYPDDPVMHAKGSFTLIR